MDLETLIDWCSAHEGFLVACSTALYVVFTCVVIVQTRMVQRESRRTLGEMRAAREAEYRPRVLFDLRFDYARGRIMAELSNQGRVAAHDVTFHFTESLLWEAPRRDEKYGTETRPLAEARWLCGIQSLMPGRRLEMFLGVSYAFMKLNEGRRLVGEVRYTDPTHRKRYTESVGIDVADYAEMSQLVEKNLTDLVQAVEHLDQTLRMRH